MLVKSLMVMNSLYLIQCLLIQLLYIQTDSQYTFVTHSQYTFVTDSQYTFVTDSCTSRLIPILYNYNY